MNEPIVIRGGKDNIFRGIFAEAESRRQLQVLLVEIDTSNDPEYVSKVENLYPDELEDLISHLLSCGNESALSNYREYILEMKDDANKNCFGLFMCGKEWTSFQLIANASQKNFVDRCNFVIDKFSSREP